MKKLIILIFIMFLVVTVFIRGEKAAIIEEVLKPSSLRTDGNQLYVSEGATIFIYSLKDYTLVKKFGRAGQGPQEFAVMPQLPLNLIVDGKHILVNSLGKISYFTKDGEYIKEIKTKATQSFIFRPLKEGFVGLNQTVSDNEINRTVNIFDAELNRGKELARMRVGNLQKKINVLKQSLNYQTHDNRIYVTGAKGFVIDVFDHTGKELYSITQEYKKIKFTPKFEKEIRNGIKAQNAAQYQFFKDRLAFPEYFPPVAILFIDNNKIYVGTYNIQGEKLEFFIFDLKGKLLKKQFFTLAFREGSLQPYPVAFKGGKLYQLIENEEEEWELHITKFD